MNRSDIIEKIHDLNPKLTRKNVDNGVKTLFDAISDGLTAGQRIEVRGFGCFSLKERVAGIVRNPRDGVSFETGDRKVVYFRAGKELKARVDNKK